MSGTAAVLLLTLVLALSSSLRLSADSPLEEGFAHPPPEARLRAYWWWLNGNVTRAAITRDLEAMAAQGFGGALICDAGGAEQRGNEQVPHGPDFFTPEWRELYRHALQEANRLGLEMSLNIQSGWNLGGPMVPPADAPKKLVWTETRITGPANDEIALPKPDHAPAFYQDLFVLAYPVRGQTPPGDRPILSASSAEAAHPPHDAVDRSPETFWVSSPAGEQRGLSEQQPQSLTLTFSEPVSVSTLELLGRAGYGPKAGTLEVSTEPSSWARVALFTVLDGQKAVIPIPITTARQFRILFTDAYDRAVPERPRNVQVAELRLLNADGQDVSYPVAPPRRLVNWPQKALHRALHFSAPDTAPLLEQGTGIPNEEHALSTTVVDLTAQLDPSGTLRWEVPDGEWEILRWGCTLNDHCRVSTCSEGWNGYALDPFDLGAFDRYWQAVVDPLIADAGPLAGTTLKYLHTDSWEVEVANWTPTLVQEFRQRRGYDPLPFLPVIAGKIIDSRPISNRFLHDFRKTMGDLAIDNHYRPFSQWAARYGLRLHPESGGPHAVPVDSLRCLGMNDAPMSEFWAWSWEHRIGDTNRFFVKQPASAAHVYGHNLVLAEGFTTIGPHWQETLWDNLKPSFDRALTEGLNRLVWHTFTCSPASMGQPGQQYFAGTHLNPNVTWWSRSRPFFDTLNRCQFLLQQGTFVADALFYYGDHVPNFAQLKRSDPARVLPGYDYDVITEDALLRRLSVQGGQLVLPPYADEQGQWHAGTTYRILVLPRHSGISLEVLRKVQFLVEQGAQVVGPRPLHASGLSGYPASDTEVQARALDLWGEPSGRGKPAQSASRRISDTRSAREILNDAGIKPDFEFTPNDSQTALDFIHRRTDRADIYFVANASNRTETVDCTFRVSGKQPELWDPLTGTRRDLPRFFDEGGRTRISLDFAPYGSWFLIFQRPTETRRPAVVPANFPEFKTAETISGPWEVEFDPAWGGPTSCEFPELVDWTQHPDPRIRFYSGTATYKTVFRWDHSVSETPLREAIFLDLGNVRELAEVRLNGHDLGIVWAPPFRVEMTSALLAGTNQLEIDVVNFWPNRIIGDASLPPDQRRTRTNIRKLTAQTPLMPSGLRGPVQVLTAHPASVDAVSQPTFPVRITVDTRSSLGVLQPIWRFFGADEPNYATLPHGHKLLSEIGALSPGNVHFRAHNLLCSGDGTPALKWGSTGVYREDSQGNALYDWTILDEIFDAYLANGVRPYAQIGFMPKDLSIRPDPYQHRWTPSLAYGEIYTGWAYPPKDYGRWADLVYAWVQHCIERYGADEVEQWYWETWNEANIPYWQGTPQEFHKLHDYAIDAVRRALPTARVGGPDCAGHGGRWMRQFLDHCLRGTNYATGTIGTPLDFVAFHAKGSPVFTNGHVRMGIANQLRTIDEGFRLVASYPELNETPIIIGESDPEGCAACQGPQLGYRNGTMYSSYTAASFARKHELADRYAVNFQGALTWAFQFENQPYFAGFRSLASNGIDKPVLNVFRMMAKMQGHRLPVESDSAQALDEILKYGVRDAPDVGALASRSEDRLWVLLWHYHDDDVPGKTAEIDLHITGQPATSNPTPIAHFRIDQQHSNAYTRWQEMGSPQQPSPEQYARLEQAAQLTSIALPPSRLDHDGTTSVVLSLPRQGVSLLVLSLR